MSGRMKHILRTELGGVHFRYLFLQSVVSLLPVESGIRLRTRLYRLAGIRIGRGTVISGRIRLTGIGPVTHLLTIGSNNYLNENITFNLGETVTLEDNVSVGMEACSSPTPTNLGAPTSGRERYLPVPSASGAAHGSAPG